MSIHFRKPKAFIQNVGLASSDHRTVVTLTIGVESTDRLNTNDFAQYNIVAMQSLNKELTDFLNTSKELLYYAHDTNKMPEELTQLFLTHASNKNLIEGPISPKLEERRVKTTELKQTFLDPNFLETKIINNQNSLKTEVLPDGQYRFIYYFEQTFVIPYSNPKHLTFFVFVDRTGSQAEWNSIDVSSDLVMRNGSLVPESYDSNNNPVFNTKIQDLRIVSTLKQQFSKFFEIAQRVKVDDPISVKKQNRSPFRSGLIGPSSYNITINLQKLLSDNSFIYNVYGQDVLRDYQNWIDIQVYRKRIISSSRYYKQEFMNNPVPWNGENKPVYLPTDDFEINEVEDINGNSVLLLNITDSDLRRIKIGQYYYGIKVQFRDPYYDLIKADIIELNRGKALIEQYYSIACTPRNFDFGKKQFTPEFRTAVQNIYPSVSEAVDMFVRKMDLFFGTQIEQSLTTKYLLLLTISEYTGTPSGILSFLELYRDLINMLERYTEMSSGNAIYSFEEEFKKNDQIIYKYSPISPVVFSTNRTNDNLEQLKQTYGVSTRFSTQEVRNQHSSYISEKRNLMQPALPTVQTATTTNAASADPFKYAIFISDKQKQETSKVNPYEDAKNLMNLNSQPNSRDFAQQNSKPKQDTSTTGLSLSNFSNSVSQNISYDVISNNQVGSKSMAQVENEVRTGLIKR